MTQDSGQMFLSILRTVGRHSFRSTCMCECTAHLKSHTDKQQSHLCNSTGLPYIVFLLSFFSSFYFFFFLLRRKHAYGSALIRQKPGELSTCHRKSFSNQKKFFDEHLLAEFGKESQEIYCTCFWSYYIKTAKREVIPELLRPQMSYYK